MLSRATADKSSPQQRGKYLTIVTGASGNHMDVLFTNLLASIQWRILDRFDESYFDHLRVLVYDLDVEENLRSKNRERISKIPFVEYRSFDYDSYPSFFNITQFAGEYAWKPTIIEDIVREEQSHNGEREVNLVYWIDSGLLVSRNCKDFDADVKHCLEHGIYTPRGGKNISKVCHQGTADYLGISKEMFHSNDHTLVSAGIFLVDVMNTTTYDKIVKQWAECALVEDCIAPPGATFRNHHQDQAALAVLLAKHSIQISARAGEIIMYGRQSTSCVVRGRENGFKIPDPWRLFVKSQELIQLKNETKSHFCENQEWAPGSAISCYERMLHLKNTYKMTDDDAKIAILDQGCACIRGKVVHEDYLPTPNPNDG